ncbi:hypothetical protein E2562_031400 [Oryza meyeriana var. granulata]|uniref:Response regulatory domain-containing protein n=1 Tax=Oryza meyeriana var. granulata TaxID=110450 RepID=A0A6G1C2S1_9ORYZ|nr:hypothetical protein E2562_031400 [Oryza meyeriana var. granulata]
MNVYTSPIKALDYLENHAQDFDLVLADVHMEELHDDLPKNTKMIKNVGTVDRNQIATRVQEHKLDLEKEMQVLPGDTELSDVYAAMQRSLQLGTIYDESDYSSDPCGDEDRSGEDEIGGYGCANYATATHSSCDQVAVAVSCNADASQEVMSKTTADHQATRVSEPADLSANEANATYSTGSLQVHVVLARNVDASQESIKSTDDYQNVPKGSGAATLKLVNYSDTESE